MTAIEPHFAGSGVYRLWDLCISSNIHFAVLVTRRPRLLHVDWNIQRVHCDRTYHNL